MNPSRRRALGVLLAWGCFCICLAASEDPGTEGLSSTSFVDFTTMAHLKSLDSSEQTNVEFLEPDFVPSTLQASPSSGFSSEENEEAKVLQSQYLWEEGGDGNDSSLYMGSASDYSLSPGKALPPKNGTQVKDSQEVSIFHQTSPSIDPDSEAPSTSALEEEEGLLPINQSKGTSQSKQTPRVTFSETPGRDSLYSLLFSTPTSRIGPAAEMATGRQEKESALDPTSSGYDPGSSAGPSLLPLSPVLSATPTGPRLASDLPLKISSEISVPPTEIGEELDFTTITAVEDGSKEGKATTHGEILKPAGAEVGQHDGMAATVAITATETTEVELRGEDLRASHEDKPQGTEPVFQTSDNNPLNPSSLVHFWDRTSEQAPTSTPIQNIQKTHFPVTATAAAEPSFIPQNRDVHLDMFTSGVPWSLTQVICKDWNNLAGKNYIILNMSDNIDCEEFRVERGLQLLALMKDAFSRYNNGLQGQWLIFLSKPNENDKHLLMTLAREHEDVSTHDVLLALGEMRKKLAEIGIQNYTTTSSCQSLPSQTHSDYGKLFVVLVIIGSICVIIIIMGLIYNCWQRRLPKMKNMSHGEELRFVENGCHDNPTLDVASDSRSEMQEKKPSVNGGGTMNGPESWDVLIDKQASEEGEVFEEDTHL